MAVSKYKTHVEPFFKDIEKWAKQGATDYEIYTQLGIGKNTFYQYLQLNEDFRDLLKRARTKAISEVQNSLFKLCVGFPYWEEVVQKVKIKRYNDDGKVIGEEEHLEKVSVQKYSSPQFSAVAYYLSNRDKKNWAANPQANEFKRKELELKEKELEMKEF